MVVNAVVRSAAAAAEQLRRQLVAVCASDTCGFIPFLVKRSTPSRYRRCPSPGHREGSAVGQHHYFLSISQVKTRISVCFMFDEKRRPAAAVAYLLECLTDLLSPFLSRRDSNRYSCCSVPLVDSGHRLVHADVWERCSCRRYT